MSITRKVSSSILLFAVVILVPALSSCGQGGKEVGKAVVGSVVGYAVKEGLNCAVKGECPNAEAASLL
ncbi:hypothetical protein DSM106972_017470 [Dulcicalothrix desertica PCC 7102]|uniref:Lipoprotein n=1 Tax=Dulcicalothrix desertica PCC 7102 TaxID=232991 RepID=A0A3S1CQP8_9CYAN|nr:hypothetical protein [Dulcicalothrix desertica]RUT08579.1 hypothetical protein DSM106972_017470 [Dulcicalothrix desertica PCC 7102]TWH44056.1 hypothetical protein CAL7102_07826 [Dulcicalothrix desertica PCC 7102]